MVEKRAQEQLDSQDVRVERWDLLEVLLQEKEKENSQSKEKEKGKGKEEEGRQTWVMRTVAGVVMQC